MAIASALITKMKTRVGLTGTISDTVMLEWLNVAAQSISNDIWHPLYDPGGATHYWSWRNKRFSFNTSANTNRYPLTGGGAYLVRPGTVNSVRFDNIQNPIEQIDKQTILDWDSDLSATGDPTHYYVDGTAENNQIQEMFMWPTPNDVRLVHYECSIILSDMLSTDTVLIPPAYHDVLIHAALWNFTMADKRTPDRHQQFQDLALGGMRSMYHDDRQGQDRILISGSKQQYMSPENVMATAPGYSPELRSPY